MAEGAVYLGDLLRRFIEFVPGRSAPRRRPARTGPVDHSSPGRDAATVRPMSGRRSPTAVMKVSMKVLRNSRGVRYSPAAPPRPGRRSREGQAGADDRKVGAVPPRLSVVSRWSSVFHGTTSDLDVDIRFSAFVGGRHLPGRTGPVKPEYCGHREADSPVCAAAVPAAARIAAAVRGRGERHRRRVRLVTMGCSASSLFLLMPPALPGQPSPGPAVPPRFARRGAAGACSRRRLAAARAGGRSRHRTDAPSSSWGARRPVPGREAHPFVGKVAPQAPSPRAGRPGGGPLGPRR